MPKSKYYQINSKSKIQDMFGISDFEIFL